MPPPLNLRSRLRLAHGNNRQALTRVGVILLLGGLLALGVSRLDLTPSYSYLNATFASGPPEGQYHKIVSALAVRAAADRGHITPLPSAGSVQNINLLADAVRTGRCEVQFALIQGGLAVPSDVGIEVLGRLPRPESVLLLGRRADSLHTFGDLRGLRIGMGAPGSGTAQLGAQLWAEPDLAALNVTISHHTFAQQLQRLETGQLDLGLFVMDDAAPAISDAVVRMRLQVASFDELEGLAHRFAHFSVGRLPMGRYDAVVPLPPVDKRALQLGTLLVANRCAPHASRIALLALLALQFPDFVAANQGPSLVSELPVDQSARQFFTTGEPEMADRYVPRLVNIMPSRNWVYVVMVVSVLFNVMGLGHRFRLWRLDARRSRLDEQVGALLGPRLTYQQIQELDGAVVLAGPNMNQQTQALHAEFLALRRLCRRQATSFLVPMGQEMSYRYQEDQIEEALSALGALLARAPS